MSYYLSLPIIVKITIFVVVVTLGKTGVVGARIDASILLLRLE